MGSASRLLLRRLEHRQRDASGRNCGPRGGGGEYSLHHQDRSDLIWVIE